MDYILEGDPGHAVVIRKLAEQKNAVLYEKLMNIKKQAYSKDRFLYWIFETHDPKEEPLAFRQLLSQRGYEIEVKEPPIMFDSDAAGYQARIDLSKTIVSIKKVVFIA